VFEAEGKYLSLRGFPPQLIRTNSPVDSLHLRQHNPLLRLIFALAVGVAGFAHLVGLEEQNLAESFVGVDARRKRCRAGDFERDKALPFRLKGRDGIGAVARANSQNIAGNLELFHRAGQCE
jgi:hypothetical protein